MPHVEHFKKSDVRRLMNEYVRDGYECHDGRIDSARTKWNYAMDDTKHYGLGTRYSSSTASRVLEKRVDELPHSSRKDLNVMSTWVITCPQELKDDTGKRTQFFELAYELCKERYGQENVINGYVHMDETTPHMHVPIVPCKDGRISSKALFTRKELTDFQKELDNRCLIAFKRPHLVLNGRTKGNYTYKELKERERANNDLTERERQVALREEKVKEREEAVITLENDLKVRESNLKALEDDFKEKMKNYTLDVKKGVETALERRDAARQRLDEFEKQKQSEMKQAHRRLPDVPEC